MHGVSNKFIDELLLFLHKYLLPLNNYLPTNMYHAKSLTRKVGLNYKTIHACPNVCILFWGVYVDLATCLKCGEKNSSWSTWPILLSIYNLPPWFVTKKFFVVLTLLILGKEYVKMHNFDVYIQPLMGELQELWKGVAAYDVLKAKGQRHFTL